MGLGLYFLGNWCSIRYLSTCVASFVTIILTKISPLFSFFVLLNDDDALFKGKVGASLLGLSVDF